MRSIIPTLLISLIFSVGSQQGNQQGFPKLPGPPMSSAPPGDGNDTAQQQVARDLAKKANEARQKALKSDTDKLVKLAAELKESVDKSNADVLSVDVIKKAEQIEKLARSVKEKMKGPN
ncbi:MAG: hypothetical protein WA252_18965 [Candidatus Sulfotelmatobacter sp.]